MLLLEYSSHSAIEVQALSLIHIWDTEIKLAQERGLDDYPVFTRKAATDVSYLACARHLLDSNDLLYPQFATHNALSLIHISVKLRWKPKMRCGKYNV